MHYSVRTAYLSFFFFFFYSPIIQVGADGISVNHETLLDLLYRLIIVGDPELLVICDIS